VSCFRWREVQLLPLLDSKSSTSPPAKSLKLDSHQNEVFFTSGDEPIADHTGVNQDESVDACSQHDSEVLLQLHSN